MFDLKRVIWENWKGSILLSRIWQKWIKIRIYKLNMWSEYIIKLISPTTNVACDLYMDFSVSQVLEDEQQQCKNTRYEGAA